MSLSLSCMSNDTVVEQVQSEILTNKIQIQMIKKLQYTRLTMIRNSCLKTKCHDHWRRSLFPEIWTESEIDTLIVPEATELDSWLVRVSLPLLLNRIPRYLVIVVYSCGWSKDYHEYCYIHRGAYIDSNTQSSRTRQALPLSEVFFPITGLDTLYARNQLLGLTGDCKRKWWKSLRERFRWRSYDVGFWIVSGLQKFILAFSEWFDYCYHFLFQFCLIRWSIFHSTFGSREDILDDVDNSGYVALYIRHRLLVSDRRNKRLDGLDKQIGLVFQINLTWLVK